MTLSLPLRSALLFFLPIGLVAVLLCVGYLTANLTTEQPTTETTQLVVAPSPTPNITQATTSATVLGSATTPSPKPSTELSIEKLFLLVNAHRDEHTVPKLSLHPKLLASAQLKLADMLEKKYYQHQDENQQTTWEFFRLAGYHYSLAGENLAFNIGTEWDIFTAWKESTLHNKEMLNPLYTDVGFATDCESIKLPDYKCIVVAHFGKE